MRAKVDYRFWIKAGRSGLYGDGLIDILSSWTDVQQWWQQRKKHSQEILIGYISYEQGYHWMNAPRSSVLWQKKADTITIPPVLFGRFKQATRQSTQVAAPFDRRLRLKHSFTQAHYQRSFKKAYQHLQAGDIYQVNLAHRFTFDHPPVAETLFWQLYHQQPVPYAALIQTPQVSVLSHSPELFLSINHTTRTVETKPMKGTSPRGKTIASDHRQWLTLKQSLKEQAELDMIIDVQRNDLARTAETGSVRVIKRRDLLPLQTVWQAQARIQAQLTKHSSPIDVIETTFPAGSITGAPKLRAMEIIHQLEPYPRQVYCGAVGYITAHGDVQLNVAIRTTLLQNTLGYYYVGSGLTLDCNAAAEYQETLTKAKILTEYGK